MNTLLPHLGGFPAVGKYLTGRVAFCRFLFWTLGQVYYIELYLGETKILLAAGGGNQDTRSLNLVKAVVRLAYQIELVK